MDAIASTIEGFDPEVTGARDAMDLVAEFSRLEHLASAGVALSARRVAQTDLWKRDGHRSPGHWLSHVTGMSIGEAISLLETAEVVEAAPDTRDALRSGAVSPRQAKAIGRAETADPAAGRRLLDGVEKRSTRETEADAARIVAAASSESPGEKAERHRKARRVWHGVDADGMGIGGWRLPIAEHTRFVAGLATVQAEIFDEKRAAGEREPNEAHVADALCRIADRAFRRDGGDPSGPSRKDDWSFAKVIVIADLRALDRGTVGPGERCEVAGQGPVPVDDVWRMIDGDAFVAAVTTKGSEISQVVHLGRRPTALQRTALDLLGGGVCSVEGCTSRARLEIDHVADWATTRRTELRELAPMCGHHHDLKTHHGYRFGPLQPNGTRRLIPPDEVGRQPSAVEPPDLTLHTGCAEPPSQEASTQGDLFDTG